MRSAVCLIVRNEVRDIAEWIAYHHLIGFDTQIIVDNVSDDGTAQIVQAASAIYDLRYHPWSDRSQNSQTLAYETVCRSYRSHFDWIAFIDADEFLVLADDIPINRFLARFEGWSAIALHWAVYGSNGHDDVPPGPIIENFLKRADTTFFPARHVKSIVRPQEVVRCINPHCFEVRPGASGAYCDAAGKRVFWWPAPEHGGVLAGFSRDPPDYTVARVNHYFTRSRAHWAAKMKRGYPSNVAVRTMADFDEHDRNEIDDPITTRYLPALISAISKINAHALRKHVSTEQLGRELSDR